MKIIRVHRSWKESVTEDPCHKTLTRRDFLARGMATGAMSVVLPKILLGSAIKEAFADTTCPTPIKMQGAFAQIYSVGGPTMGARFMSDAQAQIMSTNIASRYGILGTDIVHLGPNLNLSKSSAFAMGLMTPPTGYAPAEWAAVLAKVSGGGHLGPFNQDDGAGQDSGLLGAASQVKSSTMSKDIRINNSRALAPWAAGVPSSSVSNQTPADLARVYSMPASTVTNSSMMGNTAQAASALGTIFNGIFGTTARKGGNNVLTSATCGFIGDTALADPNFGTQLFDPNNIAPIATKLTLANFTQEEQAQLSAFYRSADGTAGGVFLQFNGRDYHGQGVGTTGPADYEEGRAIAMFLAACDRAGTKGSLIYLANGQAIANGTGQTTINVGTGTDTLGTGLGSTITVTAPNAAGDAGGSYNAGLIICFDPNGAPPTLKSTGTLDGSNGDVVAAGPVAATVQAVAGLYLSAFAHLGLDIGKASAYMQSQGVIVNASNIMVIS